jgi:hypothetical protein
MGGGSVRRHRRQFDRGFTTATTARRAIAVALTLLAVAPATADAAPTLTVVPSPSPLFINILNGIDAHGGRNVWGVGYQRLSNGSTGTLVERWDGTSWSVVNSVNRNTQVNRLFGVANIGATNRAWAVGDGYSTPPYTAHIDYWQGSFWQGVSAPAPGTQSTLVGVAALSATDAWAVGGYVDGGVSQTLAEHWDGTSWSLIPSPNPSSTFSSLKSVSMLSGANVWAVGTYRDDRSGDFRPLVEHWDGATWTVVATPNLHSGASELSGITKAGTHVWAVGDQYSSTTASPRTLVERLTPKGTWKVVPSPNVGGTENRLTSIAAVPGGLWAVGYSTTTAGRQALVLKWDGTSWTVVPGSTIGATSELWGASTLQGDLLAVGDYNDGSSKTLVERGQG